MSIVRKNKVRTGDRVAGVGGWALLGAVIREDITECEI